MITVRAVNRAVASGRKMLAEVSKKNEWKRGYRRGVTDLPDKTSIFITHAGGAAGVVRICHVEYSSQNRHASYHTIREISCMPNEVEECCLWCAGGLRPKGLWDTNSQDYFWSARAMNLHRNVQNVKPPQNEA